MNNKTNFFEYFMIYLKGILMGAADIIPGVSGGTIALITGIYTRFIDGIKGFFDVFSKQHLRQVRNGNFRKFGKSIKHVDWQLFVPLVFGIGTAIFTMSNLVGHLTENYRLGTYSFFFGLIIGSAFFLYKNLETKKERNNYLLNSKKVVSKSKLYLSLFLGMAFSFIITQITSTNIEPSSLSTFIVGGIAITAMILPGISGAFILVVLNHYEHVINIVRSIDVLGIIIFSGGALLGLAVFSKGISFMLHNYEKITKVFLIGLMLGSLNYQINILQEFGLHTHTIFISSIFSILGFLIVLSLGKISSTKKSSKKKYY